MSQPLLFERQREALRALARAAQDRAAAEATTAASFEAATEAARREVNKARKSVAAGRERETTAVATAHEEARNAIEERFAAEQARADERCDGRVRELAEHYDAKERQARAAYQDALWTVESLFEAGQKQADEQLQTLRRKAAAAEERVAALDRESVPFLARFGLKHADLPVAAPAPPAAGETSLRAMDRAFAAADAALARLRRSRLMRLGSVPGLLALFVLLGVAAAVPALLLAGGAVWVLAAVAGAAGASLLLWAVVRSLARQRAKQAGGELLASLAEAGIAAGALVREAEEAHVRQMEELADRREAGREQADAKYRPRLQRIEARRTEKVDYYSSRHQRAGNRLRRWREKALREADAHFGAMLSECTARLDRTLQQAEAAFAEATRAAEAARQRAWNALADRWKNALAEVRGTFADLQQAGAERFADWDAPLWQSPPPVETVPAGVRFGSLDVDLARLPHGLPTDERLKPEGPTAWKLPAFLPFPDRCSLLLKTRDEGRAAAVQALQSLMLRFLTSVPAGKVRFTVIDPVGLGDNFAAFMHLADYDEGLVAGRIWTETAQIEKRLADLTAHMENVIQKYLRNQYRSIEEYNAQAGEVAEPFRVLVVANFPANFSPEAARRLVSIVNSGASCGVYTLLSVDDRLPPPQGFNLSDLEQGSLTLNWKDGGWAWADPDLKPFPLELEAPPDGDTLMRLVRTAGERGRDANRVEVPFDFIAPRPEEIWSGDSRLGIRVPLGRSGATKRQVLELGRGTAQHALVAGKTGSGKSTLLHALITNLALYYSPDELELYLIDFKKGVEFKPYAAAGLPHARVVAIESEREFGLSVLQRLDAEIRARGDRFRAEGVSDLNGYRNARPDAVCPRVLLVVDEFQEFFVEDDRLAQEAALLLDRLVRQGRAFGVHILLGSQTLGGAYSLARSTIDQMAVRIALQCSDADAQLILSKDNTAARLLSRPGEAIYNDANGLVEGNDPFQVVWLPDHRRDQYLAEIRRRAEGKFDRAPLVFEGNAPAELETNPPLAGLLHAAEWPSGPRPASAWLGEAIAIKDPTAAVFRPLSGNNLLAVGQHEEAALGIAVASLLSLAAQHAPDAARFVVLDGTADDDPNAGTLARVAGMLPHDIRVIGRGAVAEALAELANEVAARQKGESADRSPRYLLVQGLQRFRGLRKSEDDLGFGRRGAERVASPAEHFQSVLRDGPALGVFSLLWCDTLPNLNRSLDRQGLRECGLRVLFQMGASDSSTLMDTPAASKLGRHRALLFAEEQGQPEKFRPYALPSVEWLERACAELRRRGGEQRDAEAGASSAVPAP